MSEKVYFDEGGISSLREHLADREIERRKELLLEEVIEVICGIVSEAGASRK